MSLNKLCNLCFKLHTRRIDGWKSDGLQTVTTTHIISIDKTLEIVRSRNTFFTIKMRCAKRIFIILSFLYEGFNSRRSLTFTV